MNSFSIGSTLIPPKKLYLDIGSPPPLPADFCANQWPKIQKNLLELLNHGNVQLIEPVYRDVERLCLHGCHGELFGRLRQEYVDHLRRKFQVLSDGHTGLNEIVSFWRCECEIFKKVKSAFLALDRALALESTDTRKRKLSVLPGNLYDMFITLFRENMKCHPLILSALIDGCLSSFDFIRKNAIIADNNLKDAVSVLRELSLYVEFFEKQFLHKTEIFYRSLANDIVNKSLTDFVLESEKRLIIEESQNWLGTNTVNSLGRLVRDELISKISHFFVSQQAKQIFPMAELVAKSDRDTLRIVFTLSSGVGLMDEVVLEWKAAVKYIGEKTTNFNELIELRKSLLSDIAAVFNDKHEKVSFALKEAFEWILALRPNQSASSLAKFFDVCLGKGSSSKLSLEDGISMFKYLGAKDVFEALYRKDLGRRLLTKRSASFDGERASVGLIKNECGAGFVSKLEGVLRDVETSETLSKEFKEIFMEKCDFSFVLLTSGIWPTYVVWSSVKYPEDLESVLRNFQVFYSKKFERRSLQWVPLLGSCVLGSNFHTGRKDLLISHCQALMLLASQGDDISAAKSADTTGIPLEEVIKGLNGLVAGKVLVEKPGNIFSLNEEFESSKFRVPIPSGAISNTSKDQIEEEETISKVNEDRLFQIDAAIVRIMKGRKSSNLNVLSSEVLSLLSFPFQPSDLKKRVESLIEREYLERDAADQTIFHYLA